MLKRLLRLFAPSAQPQLLPIAQSSVHGFSVQVEKKRGCILHAPLEGSKEDASLVNAGANWHLEVTVTYDASNPFYPGPRGPWKILMTNALLKEQGAGMVGDCHYRAPDEKFTRVEVYEKFNDYSEYGDSGAFSLFEGEDVWVRVWTMDDTGVELSFSIGLTAHAEDSSGPEAISYSDNGSTV
jgi:hypothetical protein